MFTAAGAGGRTNRRLVLFRAGCLNNKQTNLNKGLSVEADRVGMEFILQEAVTALEKGMRELLIAPVENIQHHCHALPRADPIRAIRAAGQQAHL